MKHSRKMYLVPEEVMSLIQQRNQIQTSPYVKSLGSLNQQMENTLSNSADISDEAKATLYDQTLQRYLDIQGQREKHVPIVKIQGMTPTSINDVSVSPTQLTNQPNQSQQPQRDVSDSEILESIPKKFKQQAKGLLNWVKKSPDVISWDKKGTVIVDGKPLQGSSISDLVSDQLRKRKGFEPQGREQFTETLAKLNTPEDFIRNEDRRKLMALYKSGDQQPPVIPQELSETPSKPRKALKRGNAKQAKSNTRRGLEWVSY